MTLTVPSPVNHLVVICRSGRALAKPDTPSISPTLSSSPKPPVNKNRKIRDNPSHPRQSAICGVLDQMRRAFRQLPNKKRRGDFYTAPFLYNVFSEWKPLAFDWMDGRRGWKDGYPIFQSSCLPPFQSSVLFIVCIK